MGDLSFYIYCYLKDYLEPFSELNFIHEFIIK